MVISFPNIIPFPLLPPTHLPHPKKKKKKAKLISESVKILIGQNQKVLNGTPAPRGLLEGHQKSLIVLSPGHLSGIGN